MPAADDDGARPSTRASGWLRSPLVDVVIAFGWLPFYVAAVLSPLSGPTGAPEYKAALATGTVTALALNFIHRHFVYLLYFGDDEQRRRHPRAVWFGPIAFVTMAAAVFAPKPVFLTVAWILGGWNIWHTIMQRHGIFRAYAARAGAASSTSGRLDLALVWTGVVATAAAVLLLRQDTFTGAARNAWRALPAPLTGSEKTTSTVSRFRLLALMRAGGEPFGSTVRTALLLVTAPIELLTMTE